MAIEAFPNRDDLQSFSYLGFVFECIPGIAVAGFFYPVLVAIYLVFRLLLPELVWSGSWLELPSMLALTGLWLIAACVLGTITAFILSWFCGLLLTAFNASVGHPMNPKLFISCFGGLAGYLPLSLLFIEPHMLKKNPQMLEVFILGPFLAMLVGQTGARWWARRRVLYPQSTRLDLSVSQFRISHILAFTAWCALAMMIFRISDRTALPLIFATYLPLQMICFGLGHYLDRYADWRNGIRYVS